MTLVSGDYGTACKRESEGDRADGNELHWLMVASVWRETASMIHQSSALRVG